MGTRWSFTRLVKEHGEEAALAMLPYQPGLGEYEARPKAQTKPDDHQCLAGCGKTLAQNGPCGLPYDGPYTEGK